MTPKRAIIIGAGPAGLTAAYELASRTGIQPIVLEQSDHLGGISRTINYKGNRIDIGGHRFFSKSYRVMDWWLRMLPLHPSAAAGSTINYHGMESRLDAPAADPADPDRVMLLRPRYSRIYYLRRFFDYPISLSLDTLRKLGPWRTLKIGLSYLRSLLFPIRPESTLEQFFINRFGRQLYLTFFKAYTEKVWGVPCSRISAEWGAQRIKGLSIWEALAHAARKIAGPSRGPNPAKTETSLIEQFLYPKFGPGQMWEETASRVTALGGEIHMGLRATRILADGHRIHAVEAVDAQGRTETFTGDFFFSTAPVKDLMRALDPPPPANVLEVSDNLIYRDFITVGLLVRSLLISPPSSTPSDPLQPLARSRDHKGADPDPDHVAPPSPRLLIKDNWIYIQEPDVQLGRLQIFNNWSPHLVADPHTVWLGLEYFCNDTDPIWSLPDHEMSALAVEELARIGIIDAAHVLDSTVIRVEKTYPAYFGAYDRFNEIRYYIDRFENLFLIGRNGMHRYNNQDHSMLTAMMAVDMIESGTIDRDALWSVNTESDYHEQSRPGSN